MNNEKINAAYAANMYTMPGLTGRIESWKQGMQLMLDRRNAGKISEWIEIQAREINEELGKNAAPVGTTTLCFDASNLNKNVLQNMMRYSGSDIWFRDYWDKLAR